MTVASASLPRRRCLLRLALLDRVGRDTVLILLSRLRRTTRRRGIQVFRAPFV